MMPFGKKIRNTKQIRKRKQLKLQTTAKIFGHCCFCSFFYQSRGALAPVFYSNEEDDELVRHHHLIKY